MSRPVKNRLPVSIYAVERKIAFVRGQKVMLDRDLAVLYKVRPIALRQQVKRNRDRFPDDFMFQLTENEVEFLVSQNVIPSRRSLGGYYPYAFTEQGIAMLSSVLKSKRAIQVNIAIMRAFVKLREILTTHKKLAVKLHELERKVGDHDGHIQAIFEAIHRLMDSVAEPSKKKMGFITD